MASKAKPKRVITKKTEFGDEEYVLVQFLEDQIKSVLPSNLVQESKDGMTAMYSDKKYYSCTVLGRSDDKEQLIRTKQSMEGLGKKAKTKKPGQQSQKKTEKLKHKTGKPEQVDQKARKKAEKEAQMNAAKERDAKLLETMKEKGLFAVGDCDDDQFKCSIEQSQLNENGLLVVEDDFECPVDESYPESPEASVNGNDTCNFGSDIDIVKSSCNFIQLETTTNHPQFGKKCPRKRKGQVLETKEARPPCTKCRVLEEKCTALQAEVAYLNEQLSNLQSQGASAACGSTSDLKLSPPRPGRISPDVATVHQMVELSPGLGAYLYASQIDKAATKATATATACFLLSCFYSEDELNGTNLTGSNGKKAIDQMILESILWYGRKRFPGSDSKVKMALRNKITAVELKLKKLQAQSNGH